MTIVIGVGNEFRHDDGAGPAVIRRLREHHPRNATLAVTDGEPARLIELWASAGLAVVIDAVRADPPDPGRIHELDLDTVAQAHATRPSSSHALGLGEAVALGTAVGHMPARLHIYSIEGLDFDLGPGLTAPVAAAVPLVAARIATLLSARPAGSAGNAVPLGDHEGGTSTAVDESGTATTVVQPP